MTDDLDDRLDRLTRQRASAYKGLQGATSERTREVYRRAMDRLEAEISSVEAAIRRRDD